MHDARSSDNARDSHLLRHGAGGSDEIHTGFVPELDEAMRELERPKAEGGLKKAFEQFDPTDFGFVDDRPGEERAYDMRLSDLYAILMRAGRMELWRDCVDLAGKLT